MFSADVDDAVETESPSSPIILSPSASSPNLDTALNTRRPLAACDSSNAMQNVTAVEHAMADLATSDSTFDIPLNQSTTQPLHEDDPPPEPDQHPQQQQRGESAADGVQQASPAPSTRIAVVGMPLELRDEQLVRGIFDRFGSIQSVQLSTDAVADKHSAIVEFADTQSAADAIKLDGFEVNGSQLSVAYAPATDSASPAESATSLASQPSASHPVSASVPIAKPVSSSHPPTNVAIPIAAAVATPALAIAPAPLTASSAAATNSSTASASASVSSSSSSIPSIPVARPAPTDVILHSLEFVHFKAHVPLSRVATSASQSWSYYEIGPKAIPPLILLHAACGTAAVYYQQLLSLSSRGYRVISASWPAYWTVKEWTAGFLAFLDGLHIERAHVFGASLSGMLALQFAADHPARVDSLVLCNAFADTLPFVKSPLWTQGLYWMPEFVVKEVMLQSFPAVSFYADTLDFIVSQLDSMTAGDVASRLTLTSTAYTVTQLERIDQSRVLLILPQDEVMLPEQQKERLLQALPAAKQAMLKEGGDDPYVSVADEVNLHLLVHLRSMGCLPLPAEGERAERDRQLEAASETVQTPRGLDALKEPDTLTRTAKPMPMFRPTQSAVAGETSGASAYEAIAEQVEDERALEVVQKSNAQVAAASASSASPKHFTRQVSGPSLTEHTLGETIVKLTREEEEQREKQRQEREDSLKQKGEVEARLKVIRERQEEERRQLLHKETVVHLEAEKRRAKANQDAMTQLGIDGAGSDEKLSRSYKRTSIFDE